MNIVQRSILTLLFMFTAGQNSLCIANSAEEIRLAIPRVEGNYYGDHYRRIYLDAFKRLGIKLVLISCSPLKCGLLVRQGIADGEVARALAYQDRVPDLVRVETSIISIKVSVFSTTKNMHIDDLSDFRNSGYRIAIMPGVFKLQAKLEILKDDVEIIGVKYWKSGLSKLINGEVDVYIGAEGDVFQEQLHGKYSSTRKVGTLYELPLYTYLNKEHSTVAHKLSKVLDQMKEEGVIDMSALNSLIDQAADGKRP